MAGRTLTRPEHVDRTGRDAASAGDDAGTRNGAARRAHPVGRRRSAARSQIRAQWLVLAAALTVLAGVLVAWSLERAADRVDVVSVARPVSAGTVIGPADLTTTAIAFDTPVVGLAPAGSLDALVGRVATIDLEPGVLLSAGMWADGSELAADERTVGAVLEAGTHPGGIAPGTSALAVSIRDDGAAGDPAGESAGESAGDESGTTPATEVPVRVLEADLDDRGALRVTLAVPAGDAARIARLAATDGIVLVGVPAVTGQVVSGDVAP